MNTYDFTRNYDFLVQTLKYIPSIRYEGMCVSQSFNFDTKVGSL
jgi:hypothetical protein